VVRAHGGFINVESQVGQGSTFTVTLPLAPSTPVQARTDSTLTALQQSHSYQDERYNKV
jgi:hypothetical protein